MRRLGIVLGTLMPLLACGDDSGTGSDGGQDGGNSGLDGGRTNGSDNGDTGNGVMLDAGFDAALPVDGGTTSGEVDDGSMSTSGTTGSNSTGSATGSASTTGGSSSGSSGSTTGSSSGSTTGSSSGSTTGSSGSSSSTTGGSSSGSSGSSGSTTGSSGSTTGGSGSTTGSSGSTTGSSGGGSGSTTGGSSSGSTGATTGGGSGSTTGSTGATTGGGSGSTTGGSTGATTGGGGSTTGGSTGGTTGCSASAAPDINKLGLEVVKSGFTRLVYAAQPPASTDWYLVEQGGKVVILSGATVRATAFLDVSNECGLGSTGDERGLLGLAFAPDYATSGKFYVAMTPTSGADQAKDVVREYTRSASDPFVADAGSKKTIVELPTSATNHNGGLVRFGPDGKLYVGTGDGGGSCSNNQGNTSQDVSTLFGKILRLDPSKSSPYAADGNPFASSGDARVYHYGLRNPFRFNFDSLTGELYIGDVGQDDFEEVSRAASNASGLNFGWPVYEASTLTTSTCNVGSPAFTLRSGSVATPPIFSADRKAPNRDPVFGDWVSVIGGVVYRGTALPALSGVYLFGDYVGEKMAAICQVGGQTSAAKPIAKACDPNQTNESCFVPKAGAADISVLTAIVEGNDKEIYLVANSTALYKVVAD